MFATGSALPAIDYSDLWWSASESGWGVALTQQYGMIFAAWYTYDAAGKPVWYVASGCAVSGNGCSGDLYRMAGVLAQDTISEGATLSNRLWGGLRTIGGVAELIGAGALCAVPEPTMLSKAGCVVLGAHGADTVVAGYEQILERRPTRSLTERGAAAAAEAMGATPKNAAIIALTVDIAVPVSFAMMIGAARIASLRAGRISLIQHEAQAGSNVGGHTLLKHVGKTEADLRGRLAQQLRIRAASSFTTIDMAERAISQGLRANAAAIKAWARTATSTSKTDFGYNVGSVIGHGVIRATGRLEKMTKIRIVLKYTTYNGMPYYILTAYPEL